MLSTWLAIITAIPVAVVANWIMDDTVPRTISDIKVLNSPVTPGEPLRMMYHGFATRNCPAIVHEEISDSNNILVQVVPRTGKIQRESGEFDMPIVVPTPISAAPGHAVYYAHVRYYCNPWHYIFPIKVERKVDFEFAKSVSIFPNQSFLPVPAWNFAESSAGYN